ncbi:MAG: 16S rRNA (guanine(527)-N(7))-methyltransferase RsmG [Clostridiales bacterium]|nr:16S rRNA (guanine(527)-N(7))-methyltransferase RsmG [Clostridiales bacterium]
MGEPAGKNGQGSVSAEPPKHEPIITSEEDISRAGEISPFLTSGSRDISVPLSAESIKAFQIYAAMLRKWNEKMNLTNIVDDQGIAIRHFIDSLTLVAHIEDEERKLGRKDLTLIDVGTGAGFPGIPLKVSMPELQVTLLDSLKKRVTFLDAVCEALHLQGITAIHSRAEEAAKTKQYREKFDIATARAVASLPTLCEYCLPYVKVGGIFLAMKGHAEEEIEQASKAIVTLGGTIEDMHQFVLPGTDMQRTILVIRKIRPTPARYPRGQGKPDKEPIL